MIFLAALPLHGRFAAFMLWGERMGLMSYKEAVREAKARFPDDFARQDDFLNSWYGLYWRKNRCREKIINQFGKGRRSKRKLKPEIIPAMDKAIPLRLSFWQMLKTG